MFVVINKESKVGNSKSKFVFSQLQSTLYFPHFPSQLWNIIIDQRAGVTNTLIIEPLKLEESRLWGVEWASRTLA